MVFVPGVTGSSQLQSYWTNMNSISNSKPEEDRETLQSIARLQRLAMAQRIPTVCGEHPKGMQHSIGVARTERPQTSANRKMRPVSKNRDHQVAVPHAARGTKWWTTPAKLSKLCVDQTAQSISMWTPIERRWKKRFQENGWQCSEQHTSNARSATPNLSDLEARTLHHLGFQYSKWTCHGCHLSSWLLIGTCKHHTTVQYCF